MAEHKHGEMNVDDQESTFNGFVKTVAYSIVVIFAALIFMAMVNS